MIVILIILTTILGVIAWRVAKAREKRERDRWFFTGRCLGCGYELQGSGDRCPECGRWIWA